MADYIESSTLIAAAPFGDHDFVLREAGQVGKMEPLITVRVPRQLINGRTPIDL